MTITGLFLLVLGILPLKVSSQTYIRLVDSDNSLTGRLEVFHNYVWGTVCDDSFGASDGEVCCRQLGLGRYQSHTSNPTGATPATGRIWLDEVDCSGSERSIDLCAHGGWGEHDCSHSEDVYLSCTGTSSNPRYPVRLVGDDGDDEADQGLLQVYYRGEWGTVCDDNFGMADAAVFCTQLGYGGAEWFKSGDTSYREHPIWLANMNCRGSESSIAECNDISFDDHYCSHSEDVFLSCSTARIKLTRGPLNAFKYSAGIINVVVNQQWMKVCSTNSWYNSNSICRELGYDAVFDAYDPYNIIGQYRAPTFPYSESSLVLSCSNYGSIRDCIASGSYSVTHSCSSFAGIYCKGPDIDIEEFTYTTSYEGLEPRLSIGGEVGSICSGSYVRDNVAEVACREVGYETGSVLHSLYPSDYRKMWLNYVICDGDEKKLEDCFFEVINVTDTSLNSDYGCPTRLILECTKPRTTVYIIVGVVIGVIVLITVIVIVAVLCRNKKRAPTVTNSNVVYNATHSTITAGPQQTVQVTNAPGGGNAYYVVGAAGPQLGPPANPAYPVQTVNAPQPITNSGNTQPLATPMSAAFPENQTLDGGVSQPGYIQATDAQPPVYTELLSNEPSQPTAPDMSPSEF